jgi:hypothetical protein
LPAILPYSYPISQSPSSPRYRPHWVLRSPLAVSFLRLQGFPFGEPPRYAVKQPVAPSLRPWLCFGVLLRVRLVSSAPTRLLSRGSSPFSTFCAAIPFVMPESSHSRTVPPLGFAYPPDGFSPATPSPVYFAGTALIGFCPSKDSPPADPVRLSASRCPPGIHCPGLHGLSPAVRDSVAFWALLPAGTRCYGGTQLSVARARSSPGLSPPRGPHPHASAAPSHDLPSRTSPTPH